MNRAGPHRVVAIMAAAFFTASWLQGSSPPTYNARVIGIVDGDTVTILLNRRPVRVRLYGVDAPEKKQPFGSRAGAFTGSLVFGKDVVVTVRGTDRNRRWIGDVVLGDGRKVSEELVKAGMAWWFRRYAPKDRVLEKLEAEARRRQVGLWSDPKAIPPWEWRHTPPRSRWLPRR